MGQAGLITHPLAVNQGKVFRMISKVLLCRQQAANSMKTAPNPVIGSQPILILRGNIYIAPLPGCPGVGADPPIGKIRLLKENKKAQAQTRQAKDYASNPHNTSHIFAQKKSWLHSRLSL
jgi:hypothetical protein